MRRLSGIGVAASGSWVALQLASTLRSAGAAIPSSTLGAASAVAAVLALAAALRTASWAWRGPLLLPFPQDDVAVCAPAQAEAVRAAAQLRGTMGGAGHVHRIRLALPVLAWASAGAVALAGPGLLDAPPWTMLLGVSTTATVLFPARAFFYREATGGGVVLHPASAFGELLRSAADRACLRDERGAP